MKVMSNLVGIFGDCPPTAPRAGVGETHLASKGRKMVGQEEFESSTSPLSGVRSNQLSYWPISNPI